MTVFMLIYSILVFYLRTVKSTVPLRSKMTPFQLYLELSKYFCVYWNVFKLICLKITRELHFDYGFTGTTV